MSTRRQRATSAVCVSEILETRMLLSGASSSDGNEILIPWHGQKVPVTPGEWIVSASPNELSLSRHVREAGKREGLTLSLDHKLGVRGLSVIEAPLDVS